MAGIGGHLVKPELPQPSCSVGHEVLDQRYPGQPAGFGQVSIQQSGHRPARQLDKTDTFRAPRERSPLIGFICHLRMLADQPKGVQRFRSGPANQPATSPTTRPR
ncbi:hypothetical protein GZL_09300 [Streptomyces sp. 769]|nr:hypothetical protein GZL_09300 [Streptomyces sp. 769]